MDNKQWLQELKAGDEVIVSEGDCGFRHLETIHYADDDVITVKGRAVIEGFGRDGIAKRKCRLGCPSRLIEATPQNRYEVIYDKMRDELHRLLGPGRERMPLSKLERIAAILDEATP